MKSLGKPLQGVWQSIKCELIAGHQVASGKATDSPYPAGSIVLQMPFFKNLGLDLSGFYPATLNLSIQPKRFEWLKPDFKFEQVKWIEGFPEETFWLAKCVIIFNNQEYPGWIYYPLPETKTQHYHSDQVLEIISMRIPGIQYGDKILLQYHPDKIYIT